MPALPQSFDRTGVGASRSLGFSYQKRSQLARESRGNHQRNGERSIFRGDRPSRSQRPQSGF